MGLTNQSCGQSLLREKFNIQLSEQDDLVIALAGNPNVGKSTVFNALTGLNQHTGNWPGKTVSTARGSYRYKDKKFIIVDLPGTYSLFANSAEEEIARDFICFGEPHATIVVADATCLERNLNLTLQIMELTNKVILCVNLMDEAERKGIIIDIKELQKQLGIPVIPAIACKNLGLNELMASTHDIALNIKKYFPKKIIYGEEIENKIQEIIPHLKKILNGSIDPRWVALRIIEGDTGFLEAINKFLYENTNNLPYEGVACTYEY